METPSPWAETQTDIDAIETCLECVCLSGTPTLFLVFLSSPYQCCSVLSVYYAALFYIIVFYFIETGLDFIMQPRKTSECCCLSTSPNWSYRHEKHHAQLFTRYWDPNSHIQACTASSLPKQPSAQAPRFHPLFCLLEPFAHDFRFFIMLSPS